MTEWNASGYSEQSALQKWVAERCLAALQLNGGERVLDVGCGDGKITAELAERLPRGSAVGVDASTRMIEFAREHFRPTQANLEFHTADAARLDFRAEFDAVVSFNALHWVRDQRAALQGIRAALREDGRALLQFVSQGERRSLEDVLEETRTSGRWSAHFGADYQKPYVHCTPDEYRGLATESGFSVDSLEVQLEAWDFGSREAFVDFAQVTFVEWTRMLPAASHADFIGDVLDRYRQLGDGADVFHFYQMRLALRPR